MPRRSQDIMFGDLQAKVLTKVAELYWEQQDQITDEHVNALISETLSQLREEGAKILRSIGGTVLLPPKQWNQLTWFDFG